MEKINIELWNWRFWGKMLTSCAFLKGLGTADEVRYEYSVSEEVVEAGGAKEAAAEFFEFRDGHFG